MPELTGGALAPGAIDDIVAELIPMFLEDGCDKVDALHASLRALPQGNRSEPYLAFARDVHSLKGSAASFGFPFLAVICHKLEEYLAKTNHVTPRAIADIGVYLAEIATILDRGADPPDGEGYGLFKRLPGPFAIDDHVTAERQIHALFIGPRDVQFRLIEAELKACGIDSIASARSLPGIELAVRTRPDFIMVANVVDTLSGLEILGMLNAVKALARTPMMFLMTETPSGRGGAEELRRSLPDRVRLVRKGPRFADDFADALIVCGIL